MIKAVIFDLDGVIVTTDEYHYQAWKALTDYLAIPFDREKNNRLRGVSRMDSLEIILEDSNRVYSKEEKEDLARQKNDIYVRLLDRINPADALPGIPEILQQLKASGIRIAIGSSSRNTKTILSKLGMSDQFDAVADGTDITRSKPDPEVFLCAAKKLGIDPSDCAVVEDAAAGIQAAKAAGMMAIAFGEDAAKHPDTDLAVTDIRALLQIVS